MAAKDQLFRGESRTAPDLKVSQVPVNGTECEQVDGHQGDLGDSILQAV